jgi:hypothetical protein
MIEEGVQELQEFRSYRIKGNAPSVLPILQLLNSCNS